VRPQAIAVLAALSAAVIAPADTGVAWSTSYQAAVVAAKAQHKIVLLFFQVKWDPVSQTMLHDTMENKIIADDLKKNFIPVLMDGDRQKELRRKFHVYAYPTCIFLRTDGTEAYRLSSTRNPGAFRTTLQLARRVILESASLAARLAKNPSDAFALEELAALSAKRQQPLQAAAFLSKAVRIDPRNSAGRLAGAYNSLGDYYQLDAGDLQVKGDTANANAEFEQAISFFKKGREVGKTPNDLAYSLISIASCYTQMQKFEGVSPYTEALLKLKGASEADRRAAQLMGQRAKALLARRRPKPPPGNLARG
jgi:tetratricopeptide (TPR) repeat protein